MNPSFELWLPILSFIQYAIGVWVFMVGLVKTKKNWQKFAFGFGTLFSFISAIVSFGVFARASFAINILSSSLSTIFPLLFIIISFVLTVLAAILSVFYLNKLIYGPVCLFLSLMALVSSYFYIGLWLIYLIGGQAQNG